MAKQHRLLCIVAGQRSGTTAVQSALGATGRFRNFGEIFHTEEQQLSEGSFLSFVRQHEIPLAATANITETKEIAESYFTSLFDLAGDKIPLIDVKLNSWHVLRPFWAYVHQRPFLLSHLDGLSAFFLFIRRRNVTEQVLSEKIARVTGKWHNLSDGDVKEAHEVGVATMVHQARLIIRSENFLWPMIRSTGSAYAIEYEDLFAEDRINEGLCSALESAFDMSFRGPIVSKIRKNAGSKKDAIKNYDAVEEAVNEAIQAIGRFDMN